MTRLDTAAVAQMLGISPKTVVRYLNESKGGKRYAALPFPAPDGKEGGRLYWLVDRRSEIQAWQAARPGTGYHLPPCSCAAHQRRLDP